MTIDQPAEGRQDDDLDTDTSGRSSGRSSDIEPEPIEAEFEPAGHPRFSAEARNMPPPRRSRSITFRDLILASSIAGAGGAILGAVIAIVATNANSGASTGTLAQEIDAIRASQTQLSSRADQVGGDVVTLRSRLDSQGERLGQRDAGEAELRTELAAVNAQISAMIGADSKGAPATAGTSPLGVLLSRINRIEGVIAEDEASPKTTRQMQRALADLTDKVVKVDEAQAQFTAALNKRQMAFDALENGLEKLSGDVQALGAKVDQAAIRSAVGLSPRDPPVRAGVAAAESRTIRALSALESVAQTGAGFLSQQQTLAALLPSDPDVASLKDLAGQGAPTLDDLRRDFAVAARYAERLSSPPQADGWDWLRRAIAVATPPAGPNASQEAATLIIEARRGLESGDAHSAVQAVDDLHGPAAAAFGSWRAEAARRVDLDRRLEALDAKLLGPAAPPAKDSG